MTAEENKAVVSRYFEEFHDGREHDILEEIMTPDLLEGTSARSGDIFGDRQMFVMRTIEGCTHSLGQLVGAKQTVSFHYPAFAMNPLRLYGIELRALFGQQTAYDP